MQKLGCQVARLSIFSMIFLGLIGFQTLFAASVPTIVPNQTIIAKAGQKNGTVLGKLKFRKNGSKIIASDILENKKMKKPRFNLWNNGTLRVRSQSKQTPGTYKLKITMTNKVGESKPVIVTVILTNKKHKTTPKSESPSNKQAPKITLKGSKRVTISEGKSFKDPGASAYDKQDGKLKVTKNSNLNINKAGTYKIVYKARDRDGNSASSTRVVTVVGKNSPKTKNIPAGNPLAGIRHPGAYLSIAGKDKIKNKLKLINNKPGWVGIKAQYTWAQINPKEGVYDFSRIESDLATVKKEGKSLIIVISTTVWIDSNGKNYKVPRWLQTDRFGGGVYKRTSQKGGSLLLKGHPEVDKAWANLMKALAKQFDGRIEGISLGETSTGQNPYMNKHGLRKADVFFKYAKVAKESFKKSIVWQMGNYMTPQSDLDYLFDRLRKIGVGSGGPDVHIASATNHKLAKMYAIHRKNSGVVPVSIDIQWDNWTRGGKYSSEELIDAAIKYIKPNYLVVVGSKGKYTRDIIDVFSKKYGTNDKNLISKVRN